VQKKVKIIGKILGIVVLLYLAVCVGFYVNQDNFIFQSEQLPADYIFAFSKKFTEHSIPTEDGNQLNGLLFKTERPSASNGLILYFHGNAGSLKRWGEYATDFTSLGYDVFMIDYRGYGKSTGKPNEENLYQDAQTVLNWLKTSVTYSHLIIYGRSLGSAVATHLAGRSKPDLLILEAPFDELASVLYFFPSRYRFPNNAMLPEVKCRKIIIHGTDDGVVPLSSALRLKPLLRDSDQFVIIERGGHNDLRKFKEYHKTLKEVLD